jgi:hypothetical protein
MKAANGAKHGLHQAIKRLPRMSHTAFSETRTYGFVNESLPAHYRVLPGGFSEEITSDANSWSGR